MQKRRLLFTVVLFAGLLNPLVSQARQTTEHADSHALGTSPQWLTTKVYIEGAPDVDVKDKYPGVVGISMWDPERNRYEFFYTDTGRSKYEQGGGGYFLVTGDRKTHILVPDKGPHRSIVRRLEALNTEEFTYSREVPRDMVETNENVRIYVVHAPYKGPIKTTTTHSLHPHY
ncbi:protein of unknown function [Pseudomonas synxantha]|uniref:DUF4822 domain-containing protein n=1 Tax=Pseudomonas synxantha TaxID=47883 RepID=A0AAX3I794_9PSED|nr:DUF4822 domain-containing protein [Pseudomonas synxantha]AZE67476.1 hypothetical protein C4K01_3283 [Pseudomonas synxantha]KRP47051.1 S-layer protein [Pseudomonas synxantha]SDU23730.1 protein of unknown function [Pseudomonas synxantha]VTQ98570.1 Uncharacterised protein [Pseudomonas synxantha]